jgi:hypothetical protein
MKVWLMTIILALGCVVQISAQSVIGVAFYDVDAMYDTIPSSSYDDRDYTPQGRRAWGEERYRRKVEHTAAVIDSMGMDVVALYGVENEQVVRDIAMACKSDYAYLHRTSDFGLGMDFALLYYGDTFLPIRVEEYGYALCVEGEITADGWREDDGFDSRKIAIIITRRPRDLEHVVSRVRQRDKECRIIMLGEVHSADFKSLGLRDMTAVAEQSGYGTTVNEGRWRMTHRIATDLGGECRCGVYIKRWLLNREGHPQPTYQRGKYVGGYSSSLPVYLYFE